LAAGNPTLVVVKRLGAGGCLGLLLLAWTARGEATNYPAASAERHYQAGLAAQGQAEIAPNKEDARRFYRAAVGQYDAAARVNPEHCQARALAAIGLSQLIPLADSDQERLRLIREARARFRVASECAPPAPFLFDQWTGLILDYLDALAPQPDQRVAALWQVVHLAERGLAAATAPTPRAKLQLRLGDALMQLTATGRDPAAQRELLERTVAQLRAAHQVVTVRQLLYENNSLGIALLSLGRLTRDPALLREAAGELEAALKSFPNQYDNYYNLAATWSLLGDAEQAGKYLAGAIDHDPDGVYARQAERDQDLAPVRGSPVYTAALDRRRRREAEANARELFGQALRAQQRAEKTRDSVATTALLQEATTFYQRTVEATPDHYPAQALYATALAQLANLSPKHSDQQNHYLQQARRQFATAAQCPGVDAQLYEQWATCLLSTCYPLLTAAADQQRLLDDIRQVLEDGITRARFSGLRGHLETQLATCLELLAQLSVPDSAATTNLTERSHGSASLPPGPGGTPPALSRVEQSPASLYAEALKHFQAAVAADTANRSAGFYELWGIALLRVGQATKDTMLVRQATERLLKSLELKADEPSVHYNLACAYSQLHQPDQALRHLGRSLEQDPRGVFHTSAETDPDLEALRRTDAFGDLLHRPSPGPEADHPTVSGK